MSNTEYPACINELYQGEVLGEKLFLALVNIAKNEREKYHIATVLQLETETKARLRPFLLKHGYELVEEADDELVGQVVAAYQGNTWLDFLTSLRPLVDQYLGRFEEIAAAGPDQDRAVLLSMVTHEASYVSWIEKELAREEGSLDAMIGQLKYPISAPDI